MRENPLGFGFDTSDDFILRVREITDQIVINALEDNFPCCSPGGVYIIRSPCEEADDFRQGLWPLEAESESDVRE